MPNAKRLAHLLARIRGAAPETGRKEVHRAAAFLAFAPLMTALPTVDGVSGAGVAPVKIERCSISEQAVQENPKVGYRMPQVSALTITYTNEGDVAATEIHFRVRYGGTTTAVTDRGTFAPGQKIAHNYDGPNTIFSTDDADCVVTAVTFITGATWGAAHQVSTDAPPALDLANIKASAFPLKRRIARHRG